MVLRRSSGRKSAHSTLPDKRLLRSSTKLQTACSRRRKESLIKVATARYRQITPCDQLPLALNFSVGDSLRRLLQGIRLGRGLDSHYLVCYSAL